MIIRGNMVGNVSPRSNWDQTDANKSDYLMGRTALEQKIDKVKTDSNDYADSKNTKSVTVTLTAAGWSASAPYAQSVEVAGLTDKLYAEAYPAWPDDAEAEKTMQEEAAKVSSCRRSGSTLTFRCLEDKPTVDIPVTVEVSA